MSNADTSPHRSLTGWVVPLTATVIGLGYLVAGIVGGDLGFGVFGLALMIVVAGVFLLASRHSETVAGLRDRRDERINQLDATASQVAGAAVLVAVLVMFVVEVARGRSGSPYYQLGALGGVSYVAALVYLRFRR
ncbi:MAG: hypothetical protein ABI776_13210 [Nocardioidaceae bacterium]